jgi:hypothetical protein
MNGIGTLLFVQKRRCGSVDPPYRLSAPFVTSPSSSPTGDPRKVPCRAAHPITQKGAMAMIDVQRSSMRRPRFSGLSLGQHGAPRLLARIRYAVFVLAIVSLICRPGAAQEIAATLSGTVTDSTGAVIPRASITITLNGVNGASRVVESDASGSYSAPQLAAGTYFVTATAPGFETFKADNVIVNVAEKRALNIQLKAGSVSQTVMVQDNPVSIDTESSSQVGTISGVQVRELELSNRNFEELVTLQPGVVNGLGDEATASDTNLNINGARNSANNWTVDGADINDSGSNQTIINIPSVDAIQEFTLARGNYDAGYGRSGGGQVVVATKSGTSEFHGGVYEFDRNTVFNANTYLGHVGQTPRLPYHYNDYGYTIGGPAYIPHVYNTDKKKTFFFWSYEWFKIDQPGGINIPTVLSNPMAGANDLQGDFTGAPSLPAGPAGCVTNWNASTGSGTINLSQPGCESKNAAAYVSSVFSKYAVTGATANYVYNYSNTSNRTEDIVRVDHYFNDKVHFFARGMDDDMPVGEPFGLWAGNNFPGLVNTAVDSPGKNVVGNLTWSISPTVVNEVEFVWSQGTYHSTIAPGQFATNTQFTSSLTGNSSAWTDPYSRVPAISINNLTGFSAGSAPWKERNLDRTYFDNLAITRGKHTLRMGFQFQQMLKNENATYGEPSVSFADWGDFLLGNAQSYSHANRDIVPDLRFVNSEAYVQDDWKILRKLTLNLGVRWSHFPTPSDAKDTLNNFDPLIYSASKAPAISPLTGNFAAGLTEGSTGVPLIPAYYTNGIIFPQGSSCTAAQAITGSQVTCSPYGSLVNPTYDGDFAPRVGFAYNPDGRGVTSIRGGFGIFYDRLLDGIFEQNAFSDPPLVQTVTASNVPFDNPAGNVTPLGPNGLVSSGTPAFKVPSYANFNLSVQRQLLPTTVLEVAYVGNEARHLLGDVDLNQPTLGERAASPNVDVNGIRPYLGYASIKARLPIFTNNYNSLQVTLSHKAHGLTLGAAYTWSKDLTTQSNDRNTANTYTYNLNLDYGPSASNTPQVFEANYIYELPFYHDQHGVTGHLLGGWQLSGITSMVSGQSFQVTQVSDPWACSVSSAGTCAAGSPAGTGLRGLGIQQGIFTEITPRMDQVAAVHYAKSVSQWFSTSSFVPAAGHFGSEGSNSLLGPGLQRWDLASIKNLNLGERVHFQLRGEYFNAFNHTSFSTVDSTYGDPTFGQITNAHLKRVIQLGGKLNF